MKTLVYLSRSFVEFGPFTVEEMKDFYSRGILQEIDHIHLEGSSDWLSVVDWVNSQPAKTVAAAKPAAKAPAKKAVAAKEPAKKPVAAKAPAKKAKPGAR